MCTCEMAVSTAASPTPLALLLERVATQLPAGVLVLVLRDLPMIQLARLACVHKAYLVAWRSMQDQDASGPWPELLGPRYAPPSTHDTELAKIVSRLERAAMFGDVAVIRAMVAAGVDEHGSLLLEARNKQAHMHNVRFVDMALSYATRAGHVEVVELLLDAGAMAGVGPPLQHVHSLDGLLYTASEYGRLDVVQLLLQSGANVHAFDDLPLRRATTNWFADVVQLLLQHGANVHAADDEALLIASRHDDTDIVELLIEHGANVHAADSAALRTASRFGYVDVVELLLQHGADGDSALMEASRHGHEDVVQLLLEYGAVWPSDDDELDADADDELDADADADADEDDW